MIDGVSSGRQDDERAAGVGLTAGGLAVQGPHPAERGIAGTLCSPVVEMHYILNKLSVDGNFNVRSAPWGGKRRAGCCPLFPGALEYRE